MLDKKGKLQLISGFIQAVLSNEVQSFDIEHELGSRVGPGGHLESYPTGMKRVTFVLTKPSDWLEKVNQKMEDKIRASREE